MKRLILAILSLWLLAIVVLFVWLHNQPAAMNEFRVRQSSTDPNVYEWHHPELGWCPISVTMDVGNIHTLNQVEVLSVIPFSTFIAVQYRHITLFPQFPSVAIWTWELYNLYNSLKHS